MESVTSLNTKSEKSATTALLLCIFLGGLGAHRFYTGKIGTGILMLITLGGVGIWTLIDLINISYSNFTDKQGRYLEFEKRNEQTSSKVKKTILLVFGLLILFFVTIITFVYLATSGLTNVAREQLAAIRAHDISKAYSYTSSGFKKNTTEAQFEKFLEKYPALMENKDSTFTKRAIENDRGAISGTVEGKDGEILPIIYYFVKEDGQWKILSIEVAAEPQDDNATESE